MMAAAQCVGVQKRIARFEVAVQVTCEHEEVSGCADAGAFGREQLARAELLDGLDYTSVGTSTIWRQTR